MATVPRDIPPEQEKALEAIPSEEEDEQSSFPTFETLTYPADFTLQVLVDKLRKRQIIIPHFQRRFVWTQIQSSKLIESFLLGLPVPPIFLYASRGDNTLLVVDGQQRLRTIGYFYEGLFGEEDGGRRRVFRLTGLHPKSPFAGKTLEDLREADQAAFNKLNDSVLRAFVIKQLNPRDGSSIYHVFERLNTGGTLLHPQEIRNCIYHGRYNDLLLSLNEAKPWRQIFGQIQPERRQRDVELILRFFALYHGTGAYERPMKDFLNQYMKEEQHASDRTCKGHRSLFTRTVERLLEHLGPRPFHIRAGLNAAVCDSVMTAFAHHLDDIPQNMSERYDRLKEDADYLLWVGSGTTEKTVLTNRLERAANVLFG